MCMNLTAPKLLIHTFCAWEEWINVWCKKIERSEESFCTDTVHVTGWNIALIIHSVFLLEDWDCTDILILLYYTLNWTLISPLALPPSLTAFVPRLASHVYRPRPLPVGCCTERKEVCWCNTHSRIKGEVLFFIMFMFKYYFSAIN